MGYLLDQMEKVASFAEQARMEKLAKNRAQREATRKTADLANEAGKIKNKERIAQLEGALDEALAKVKTLTGARDAALDKVKQVSDHWLQHSQGLEQKATQYADDLANFKNLGRFAGAAKWIKGNPKKALATAVLGGGGLLGGAGAAGYALNNGPKPAPKPVYLGSGLKPGM